MACLARIYTDETNWSKEANEDSPLINNDNGYLGKTRTPGGKAMVVTKAGTSFFSLLSLFFLLFKMVADSADNATTYRHITITFSAFAAISSIVSSVECLRIKPHDEVTNYKAGALNIPTVLSALSMFVLASIDDPESEISPIAAMNIARYVVSAVENLLAGASLGAELKFGKQ